MASVVFLRAVNVGGANRCRPAQLARELKKFDIVNIGAVGTFVVRKKVADTTLRAAISKNLSFQCETMIVPGIDILKLAASDPFKGQPSGENITRFLNVAVKPITSPPPLPLVFKVDDDWLVNVFAVKGQFVLGLYRRHMKAIGFLGKLEKQIGLPLTNRNWNTIEKVVQVLQAG